MAKKWTIVTIRETIKSKCKELGYFPSQAEWAKMGLGGMVNALYANGLKLHEIASEFGFPPDKNPKGYWKDFQNVKKALTPLIKQNNGIFPTQDMIISNTGKSVFNAIYQHHNGMQAVAKKMGYELSKFHIASDGHYVDSANEYLLDEYLYSRGIEHEVRGVICNTSFHQFDFKVDDYYIEIWGYEKDRKNNKIVERYNKKRKKKEEIYKNLNLKLISIEAKVFKKKFEEIEKYFDDIFSELGFDITPKKKDFSIVNVAKHCYFWNEEKIIHEVKEEIEKQGWEDFPSGAILKNVDRGDLADAIKSNKGFPYYRKKLGYGLVKKPDGYWNDGIILEELKSIIKKLGHFPVLNELKSMDRHDLVRAINNHGGFPKFQELLGFEPQIAKRGSWTKEVMLEKLDKIWNELGKRPTYSEVRKIDKKLSSAIDRNKQFTLTVLLDELERKEN